MGLSSKKTTDKVLKGLLDLILFVGIKAEKYPPNRLSGKSFSLDPYYIYYYHLILFKICFHDTSKAICTEHFLFLIDLTQHLQN